MTKQKQHSEYVDSFGEYRIPEFKATNLEPTVFDGAEAELHADGSYTLHLDANWFLNAFTEQWYSTPEGVLEFHGDSDFFAINSREQAEEEARRIAYEANKDVHENYIKNADKTPEEVIAEKYEASCGTEAPAFTLKFYGNVEIVDPEDLVKLWEVERDED